MMIWFTTFEFQRKLYFPLSDEIFRKCAVSTI
jgi:hypothetical protein